MLFRLMIVTLLIATAACQSKKTPLPPMPIAHVESAAGIPYVSRLRQSYILGRASQLYRGDIIRTDDTTHVVVRFVDGSVASVGPQSHLVLHQYSLSKKRRAPTALLTLNRGSMQFRSSTAMLLGRASLTIRTPLAVVESRSNNLIVSVAPDRPMEALMLTGRLIRVRNDHGESTAKNPTAGISVGPGSAPRPPRRWSTKRVERALNQTKVAKERT
ncbi:MAG: FecR domain-containing protein [Pseudomonadota bacterium]